MGCKGRHQSHARAPDSATRARCALIAAAGLKLMKSRTSFRCFLGTGKKRKEARAGWRVGEAKRRRRESREQRAGGQERGPLSRRTSSLCLLHDRSDHLSHAHTHTRTNDHAPTHYHTQRARLFSPSARARPPSSLHPERDGRRRPSAAVRARGGRRGGGQRRRRVRGAQPAEVSP